MALRVNARGAECERARILAGFSAPQAAVQLGCTAVHVRNVETNKSGASPSLAKKMAELYGVDMESLFEFADASAAA